MTELTLLDIVTFSLLVLMILGLWGMLLEWLDLGDRRRIRVSQCPPHDWHHQYVDDDKGGFEYKGLRCGKCKRSPDGLINGESWQWPNRPTPP